MSLFEKLAQRDQKRYEKKIAQTQSPFYPLKKTARTVAKVGAILYFSNALWQGQQLANSQAAQAYGKLAVHGAYVVADLQDDIAFHTAASAYIHGKTRLNEEFNYHWQEANKAWEITQQQQEQLENDVKSVYDPIHAIFH